MNKFNNPRLTNTTVSGTGVKHPMRPHVILGDPENGFIRGDLLDANAVIKLIKNAAKAIGALEELEQSNWIDDDATTAEYVGVLQPGEVGFVSISDEMWLARNNNGVAVPIIYRYGSESYQIKIVGEDAFGKTIAEALSDGVIIMDGHPVAEGDYVDYSTISTMVILNATMPI